MTSPWVKFLNDHSTELAMVLILMKHGAPLEAAQIATIGKTLSPILAGLKRTNTDENRKWLVDHGLITVEGTRPMPHSLTDKGERLGQVLEQLEQFIRKEMNL